VAGLLAGAVVAGFALVMPARTLQGARALEQALGLRDFLRRGAEGGTPGAASSSLFERLLPFAVALGAEREWGCAFEAVRGPAPAWYRATSEGAPGFTAFLVGLPAMVRRVANVIASRPPA
jgi:hypothetical protein